MNELIGENVFRDKAVFLNRNKRPTIIDVGANVGQTALRYNKYFNEPKIHSFEPDPYTFEELKKECKLYSNIKCWNYGVGSENTELEFNIFDVSQQNSFLELDGQWSKRLKLVQKKKVNVITIDSFAEKEKIDFIHLLKSDTQGFDFEVLKGASNLMDENKIGLVHFEFIFRGLYKNIPKFDEVFKYLTDKNFLLVSTYNWHYKYDVASWCDMLFINKYFLDNDKSNI